MEDSYLKIVYTAFRDDLTALFAGIGITITWDAYGEIYPAIGAVSGAISIQQDLTKIPVGDFSRYPRFLPIFYKINLEFRRVGENGVDDVSLIYDLHEMVTFHLLREVRTNGLAGTLFSKDYAQVGMGLEIDKNLAGIVQFQQNLVKLKSQTMFTFEYQV